MPAKAEIKSESVPVPVPEPDCTSQLDAKLEAKDPRLPRRISAYIRRLKQEGRFDEAIKYRERAVSQKKARNERLAAAADELHKTIAEVICTDDPVKEAAGEIKITWLFNAVGEIETSQERNREINEIFDSKPLEVQPKVEELMPAIRDEMVAKFMPLAG